MKEHSKPSLEKSPGADRVQRLDNCEFYEAFARYYEEVYRDVDPKETVRQWLLLLKKCGFSQKTSLSSGKPQLLDVGCGPGWHLVAWAAAGFQVVGLDASPSMLAAAKRNLSQAGLESYPLNLRDVRQSGQVPHLKANFDIAVGHFNFLNLFAPSELRSVFQGVAWYVRSGGLWVTDYFAPKSFPTDVEETDDLPNRNVRIARAGAYDPRLGCYRQRWRTEVLDKEEYFWFYTAQQFEEMAAGDWSLLSSFEWHPFDRERPLIPVTSDSERIVAAFRRL